MWLQVPKEKLIVALSLANIPEEGEIPIDSEITDQVILLVWDVDISERSKQASPVVIELLEGTQPVSVKQYLLRHEA